MRNYKCRLQSQKSKKVRLKLPSLNHSKESSRDNIYQDIEDKEINISLNEQILNRSEIERKHRKFKALNKKFDECIRVFSF